jgi:HAMP domain-containing protein
MWIWIAAVVLAVIVLLAAALPLLGRLSALRRAGEKLGRRQAEAMRLQEKAAELERSVQALQERAEQAQRRVAVIKAARGGR